MSLAGFKTDNGPEAETARKRKAYDNFSNPDEFLELVLDQALERARMEVGALHVLEPNSPHHSRGSGRKGRVASPAVSLRIDEGPLGQVFRSGEPVLVHEDHDDAEWREWLQQSRWRSALLIPLRAREQTVGVMSLGSLRSKREVSADEQQHLHELATRAAMAILYDSVVRAGASDLPELINNLGRFSPSQVLEGLLDFLLSAALNRSKAEVAVFLLFSPPGLRLCAALIKGTRAANAQELKTQLRERLGGALESRAADAPDGSGRFFEGLPAHSRFPVALNGNRYGELVILHTKTETIDPKTHARVATVAEQAAKLLHKTSHLKNIEQIIFTDPLTGVYTRNYWKQRADQELDRAARRKQPLSVLLFDLDYFKKINDTCGHPAGDSALCAVAETLRQGVRKHDVVARYGGEEFIILLTHASARDALMVANRLLSSIDKLRVPVGAGVEIHVTASGGLAITEDGAFGVDELIHKADAALYQAKRSGRNKVCAESIASASESSEETPAEPPMAQAISKDLLRATIARLCHEVNNPATAILGSAELLMETHSEHLDETTKKTLRVVMEQALRIGRVTRRMTDMNRFTVSEQAGILMLDLPDDD